jgi:hypothetical protein
MATRSNIAYKTPEGKIRSIYAHWDGYPAHNGEMLRRYYKDFDKIVSLVSNGQLSILAPQVNPTEAHSFDAPQEDVCVFYGRDRGETNVGYTEYDDIPSWIDDMEEYAYLWNGQDWLVNDHGERDDNGFPIFDLVENKVSPALLKEIGWEDE